MHIDRADPSCWVNDEMLKAAETDVWNVFLSTYDPDTRALTLMGDNLTVIYRVTDTYDHQHNCWLAVWPD